MTHKKTYNEKQLLKFSQDKLEELMIIEQVTGIDHSIKKQQYIDTIQDIKAMGHIKDGTLFRKGLLEMNNIDF